MRCAACGQENPERAKFCLECGTALAAAAPEPSRESRRVVTVVFADMVGFTSLGESLDQESLRRVMDRFYDGMRSAIEGETGTLAKFIGDAVLAVWGTPEVREDDALRAVRAAEAMRRELARINEELESRWGVHVGMRTGVNTGEVVVDPTRPADLLVGDTLNVAARLEQAAADGVVLIGPETYRLVRDHCDLEPVEPLGLKGKARPMPAWRLVDGLPGEGRADERLRAPLVGRADELAVLRAAFDDAVTSGAARMATVIGSPGLGKTRLVAEFVQSLGDDAIVLHGRCQATGEGITFQPVAEVLRGAAGITDDDSPEAARAKLETVLGEEPRVAERAAGLLGLGPVATTEETFWAVRRILEALARGRPVVLVHDDIHWGQPTFLDLLEYFVAWIRDAPVLIVGLARPELREVRPALAELGDVVSAAIDLEPLDAAASRSLVEGLLGATDLPPALAERVLETTEGNPLFLSEMLRMLADEGVLRREGDTWIAADVGDVAVPPTIHALLAARIERLAGHERSVVERASVIGHQFYRGAVAELAPESVRPLVDDALETLARKELVRPEDEWWLDERVFRFHHVLIRDAAYRTLLKEARADLHERFAAWLEAKAGELAGEHEEIVAFHLEQAHGYRLELGPLDDAGRVLAARAAARLHSAGRRALAREDLPAAANLLRRALAPLTDAPGRLAVVVDLAEALLSAGDTGAAEQVVEELGLGAGELGDDRLAAWATVFACQLDNLTGAGHVRETADQAAAAAETLARHDDRAGEAKAWQVVAQAEAQLGQVAVAETALDRALVAARAADDRRRITAVLSGAPRAALWGPAPIVRASGRCLDVVRILRMTPGNRHVEAAALRCQAVLEAMRGRADAARGILDTSRATLEELGLALELADTDVHAGIVELLAGDAPAAEAALRAAQSALVALGVEGGAAQAAALLSRALLEQDRVEEALEATRFAEARGGEDLKTTATWLCVRAEALAREGAHAEARELVARAVALTEPTDALADKADALMALAAVAALAGDAAGAAAAAREAQEAYAAKDHSVGVERAGRLGAPESHDLGVASQELARSRVADGAADIRTLEAFADAHNRRDYDAIAKLYHPDFCLVDTRQLGWETWDHATAMENQRGIAKVAPDYRMDFGVLAAGRHVRANTVRFTGTMSEGIDLDFSFGCVQLGGEHLRYVEVYDAEDEAAMFARFEELQPLVQSEPGVPEVAYARFSLAYNRRDWDAVRATGRDDVRFSDRRMVGWEEFVGNDTFVSFLPSTVEAGPDIHFRVEKVLARSDRAIALTSTSRAHGEGGAEFVIHLGQVSTFDDEGRFATIEFWDPEDQAAMFARFAELDREPSILDPMAMAFNARDWDAMAGVFTDDYRHIVHRPIEAGTNDAAGFIAAMRHWVEIAPDLLITRIAAEERRGQAEVGVFEGAGEANADGVRFELHYGYVAVRSAGRLVAMDLFDQEDSDGREARFAKLAPGPEQGIIELALNAWLNAYDRHDWESLARFCTPDVIVVDHRPGLRHEMEGRDAVVGMFRQLAETAPSTGSWEVLDVRAGHVAAARSHAVAVDGTWEMKHDQIFVRDAARRVARIEIFAPDQQELLARRLDELEREPPPPGPDEDFVGDRPAGRLDEPVAGNLSFAPGVVPTSTTELFARYLAAANSGGASAFELWADDYREEDHRAGLQHDVSGGDVMVRSWSDTQRTYPDLHAEATVLAADGNVAHVRVAFASVSARFRVDQEQVVVGREGKAVMSDIYDLGDTAAAAHYHALVAHDTQLSAFADALNRGDEVALRAQLTDDFRQVDRRALGAVELDADGFVGMLRTARDVADDMHFSADLLVVEGEHRVARSRYTGESHDGGGHAVLEFFNHSWLRDGRLAGSDLFDTEREARASLASAASWPTRSR